VLSQDERTAASAALVAKWVSLKAPILNKAPGKGPGEAPGKAPSKAPPPLASLVALFEAELQVRWRCC
jgi:hypothetical protein